MAFHLGLLFFGWWLWLYAVPILGALSLLLRAELRHEPQQAMRLAGLGACVRNAKPTGESLDALHHEGPKSQKLGQPLPGSRILSFFLHK